MSLNKRKGFIKITTIEYNELRQLKRFFIACQRLTKYKKYYIIKKWCKILCEELKKQ